MNVFRSMFLIALAFALSAPAWSEDTLESVRKDTAAKWDALKTFSATVDMQMDIAQGETKISITGTGTVDCLKKNGIEMIRTEMTISSPAAPASPTAPPGQSMQKKQLRVFDGVTTITETEMNGLKRAVKTTKAQSAMSGGGKALFDQLEQVYTLSLLPSEKVGDRAGYVVQGVRKAETPQSPKSVKFSLDKETGAMLKSVIMDDAGKPQLTTTVKDFKINPDISEERFKYTPPAGVQVVDADAMKPMGAGAHGSMTPPANPAAPAPALPPAAPVAPATPAPAPAK